MGHLSKTHYHTLDGMRGIAAIAIVLYHFFQGGPHAIFNNAPVAVDIFFILSGFVIAYSYGENLKSGMSPYDYTARRVIRLYPMYMLGIILGAVITYFYILPNSTYSVGDLLTSATTNLLLLPYINDGSFFHEDTHTINIAYANNAPIFITNGALWSLFFEMIASVAFIGLVRCKLKALVKIIILSLALLLVLAFFTQRNLENELGLSISMGWGSSNIWGGFPRVIYGFTWGMVIFASLDALKAIRLSRYFTSLPCKEFLLYLCLILVFAFPLRLRGLYYYGCIICVAPPLVYLGAITPPANEVSKKIAQFLGWISYPIYCLHAPLIEIICVLSRKYNITNPYELFAIYLFSLLIICILVTKWYDEPVRKYFGAKLRKRFT